MVSLLALAFFWQENKYFEPILIGFWSLVLLFWELMTYITSVILFFLFFFFGKIVAISKECSFHFFPPFVLITKQESGNDRDM